MGSNEPPFLLIHLAYWFFVTPSSVRHSALACQSSLATVQWAWFCKSGRGHPKFFAALRARTARTPRAHSFKRTPLLKFLDPPLQCSKVCDIKCMPSLLLTVHSLSGTPFSTSVFFPCGNSFLLCHALQMLVTLFSNV